MAHNNFIMTFFFIFTLLIILSFNPSKAQMVPAVFVFGDSLVDVGNNNYLPISIDKADFPHNGIDFPTKTPTGRFSNGKNPADFLSEKVGLPSSPPYLSLSSNENYGSFLAGVSFASGGAGIFNSTDEIYQQAIPLARQINYYTLVYQDLVQQLGSSGAQNHLSKSLFAVLIGSNDILDYFGSSDLQRRNTPQQLVDLMANTLKGDIKKLYNNGARKFVFTGIGAIGCIPSQRIRSQTEECNEEVNYWSVRYNEGLKSMLQELKSELKGISYSYFETYNIMQSITQNPASYGFTEVKAACCGLGELNAEVPCVPISTYCSNRRDHLFWDLYHPTEAGSRIYADTLFDGPLEYTFPLNVRQLVAV